MSKLVDGFCEDVKNCYSNKPYQTRGKKRAEMKPGTYKPVSKNGVILGFIYLRITPGLFESHTRSHSEGKREAFFQTEKEAREWIVRCSESNKQ